MPRIIRILCAASLTLLSLVGSSLPVRADEERDERCERDRHRAEEKLRDAVQRHGGDSRQARKRREQLEEVKHRCGDRHDEHHDHDMKHDQPLTGGGKLGFSNAAPASRGF